VSLSRWLRRRWNRGVCRDQWCVFVSCYQKSYSFVSLSLSLLILTITCALLLLHLAECQRGTDNCVVNQECFNLPGSFECLIKEFEPCPSLGDDAACISGLQCAKTSRSDASPICCAETGLCKDGVTECCNGAYNQGESCPSESSSDCAGSLTCGREVFDATFRCCTTTEFRGSYRVCTVL